MDSHRSEDGAAQSLSPASRPPSGLLPEPWAFLEPPRLYPIPSSQQPAWQVLSARFREENPRWGRPVAQWRPAQASGRVGTGARTRGKEVCPEQSRAECRGAGLPPPRRGSGSHRALQLHTFPTAPLSSPPTTSVGGFGCCSRIGTVCTHIAALALPTLCMSSGKLLKLSGPPRPHL